MLTPNIEEKTLLGYLKNGRGQQFRHFPNGLENLNFLTV